MNLTKTYRPFSLVEGGIPQGSLIELSGSVGGGRLEALMRFLSENPALAVAWVDEGMTTYPCAFPQHGVGLERVLFVNAEAACSDRQSRLMDCAHQILRSQVFGVLVLLTKVISTPQISALRAGSEARGARWGATSGREIELRRLQLAAEKSGTIVFVVREEPSREGTWPLTAQFQIARVSPSLGDLRGELRVKILKCRFQAKRILSDSERPRALA